MVVDVVWIRDVEHPRCLDFIVRIARGGPHLARGRARSDADVTRWYAGTDRRITVEHRRRIAAHVREQSQGAEFGPPSGGGIRIDLGDT